MADTIVIDEATGTPNLYIEVRNVRSLQQVQSCMKSKQLKMVGDSHGPFTSAWHMLSELQKYENTKARQFENSDYKARFGQMFNIMLPKSSRSWTKQRLLDVAKHAISFIVGEEKNLGWIAFTMTRKRTVFLKVWISDRAFYDYSAPKKYNRNIYVSKETNRFCKSDDPNAALVHKKGEIICDENGNPRVERSHFYPRKSRIFCYASENAFVHFCEQLKHMLLNILTSLRGCLNVVKEMIIRRKKLKKIWNRHIRRITAANNRARAYVQERFNVAKAEILAIFPTKMDPPELSGGPSLHILPADISAALRKLFETYTEIFKRDVFEYGGVEIRIFGGSPATVEEACNLLMRMFDRDIAAIRAAAADYLA